MPSLRSTLDDLAQAFAADILAAIRTATLDELVGDGHHRGNGRRARPLGGQKQGAINGSAGAKQTGLESRQRLGRRSAEDIERTLGLLVAALRAGPMGASAITSTLGIERRELSRVIALGLSTTKLRKKGQRRGTIYSAA